MGKKSKLIPSCIELPSKDILEQIKRLGYKNQKDMETKLGLKLNGFSSLDQLTRSVILIGYIMNKYDVSNSLELQERLSKCAELVEENEMLVKKLVEIERISKSKHKGFKDGKDDIKNK